MDRATMTSISSPTSLATFSNAQASSSKLHQSHVMLSAVHGAATPFAVAAVQGDGVWTYDLNTLRPTASYTVQPSTIFVTRPISFMPPPRHPPKGKAKAKAPVQDAVDDPMDADSGPTSRTTVIGIGKGDKIKRSEEGRFLWMWRKEDDAEKEVLLLDKPLYDIHHIPLHRAAVLCVHIDGSMTVVDANLQIRPVVLSSLLNLKGSLLAAGTLDLVDYTVSVILVGSKGSVSYIKLELSGGRDVRATLMKEISIGYALKQDLKSASVDSNGAVVAIGHDDSIISIPPNAVSQPESPYELPSLLQPPQTPMAICVPTPGLPLALLADTSCNVLLASISSSLPAVLSVFHLSDISPTTTACVSHLAILASNPGSFTLGLVLTHRDNDGGRSVVYTLDVSISDSGIGINSLLGSQVQTQKYLSVPVRVTGSKVDSKEITSLLEEALQRRAVDEAEERFRVWMSAKEDEHKANGSKGPMLTDDLVQRIVSTIITLARKGDDEAMPSTEDTVIEAPESGPAEKPLSGPYAGAVLGALLDRGLLKDEFWSGGVLQAGLLPASDWVNIRKAIGTVPDIPSSAIVNALERAQTSLSGGESNIDDFTFESLLREVVSLPPPAPGYRTALFSLSLETCMRLLDAYVNWLTVHVESMSSALDAWIADDTSAPSSSAPPVEALILHSNLLLDARLQTLLSHPPAWDLLEKMQVCLSSLMEMQDVYRKIHAPIEAVLTLARREAQSKAEEQAKRLPPTIPGQTGHAKGQQFGKQNRKLKVGMSDEVIGKWRVEDLIF
ncbi:hypothetical protein BD324DRAFT_638442 [Kockovaella imperatae]|uniref:Uncharacterized protein n=1 Tax=Kockovaella imperatae TaxID=4999 RepID=A0A1Y1U6T8_9TREE|nr:hypothetical protein BD324DRAFT_638442 [Kockovaella imperatae]ORX33750.1 hypothetical protein BD324DRAFT_638442 [Kockovaella imperatae]